MKKSTNNTSKKRLSNTLLWVIVFIISFILIVLNSIGRDTAGSSGFLPNSTALIRIAVITLIVCFGAYLHIFIHETGHLIAGKLSGYTFVSYRVNNFLIMRENDKLASKWCDLPGNPGQCIMSPPDVADEQFIYPFTFYILGGGLANFLVSILFLPIFFLTSGLISLVILSFMLVGIGFGIISIIPLKMFGVTNDAYNLRLYRQSLENRRAFWINLRYVELFTKGTRVSDMPREWFDNLKLPPNEITGVVELMWCLFLTDQGDIKQARDYAILVINNPGTMLEYHLNELRFQVLFAELVGENRPEEIEKLYTESLQAHINLLGKHVSTRRGIYAYERLHTKDEAKASEALTNFESACVTTPYKAEIPSERALIELVKQAAE